MPTSRLEIDLSAIERNVGIIRRVVGSGVGVGVCAVLKQDAYGAGAPRVGKRLAAAGVEMIAVYTPDEARALVEAAVTTPILILMPVRQVDRMDHLYRHAVSGRVHLTLHDMEQIGALAEAGARLGVRVPVHIQVDTGMSRGGSTPDQAAALVEAAARSPRMRIAGVMTHFASPCSDAAFTREQAKMFREWMERVRPALVRAGGPVAVHAANSCATFRSNKYHGTMVRVGQSLFGYVLEHAAKRRPEEPARADEPVAEPGPGEFEYAAQAASLEPAVRWTTSIVHVTDVPTGWPVGYGSTWRAQRLSRIALAPVGYADGYPRSLGNAGWVGLTGRAWERTPDTSRRRESVPTLYVPVVGRVSMDQVTIDVTDAPEAMRRLGAEVELYGGDRGAPNHLPAVAHAARTITHELLTRIGSRVERVYRYPAAAGGAAAGTEGAVRLGTPTGASAGGGMAGGAVAL